ncbi:MAG: hypothetical protein NDI60_04085, partial [Elusimicrobiales bacterium]|nr:hypothetical protein [Elusimicrobiales bacterium]
RTIWYTPEAMGMVFKYGVLTLMGIVAMVVISIGFLKLAAAMQTMAKAQQGHQISMDFGKGLGAGGPGGGAPGDANVALSLLGEKGKDQEGGKEEESSGKVVFDVKPDKVPFLVKMMSGEDPGNVALVAAHLPPEVRGEFLRKLPPKFASDVIINMANIRFVEPEIITTLKDELERRLSGAVGGIDGVLDVIGSVNLRAKKAMLEELRQKQPELADEVRKHVLMPEDLALFSERDFSVLLSVVKIDGWATAMPELAEPVRERIKAQMAEKTWQMVEQSMRYGTPSPEKMEDALEQIMASIATLIKEGKVANPLDAAAPLIAEEKPAAAGGEKAAA